VIQVSAVPYEYVDDVWPHVKAFIGWGVRLQPKLFSLESVRQELDSRVLALWIMIDDETGKPVAAATTRIIKYPKCSSVMIDWLGGKRMNEWLPQFSAMMDRYAKDNGCTRIEGAGRKGWLRALAPYGYRQNVPMYVKELEDA